MIKTTNTSSAVIVALPILIWIGLIWGFSVNVPWFDDFDPFPDFLIKWRHSTGFSEKLQLLLQPNNEHRMLAGKLVTLIYYYLTGTVNFSFLQFCGAGFMLGTCWLLYTMFRKLQLPLIYFLPVPLLLFQFQFHLIFLWAICSLQHQPSVFFVCLSLFFLARKQLAFAIPAALAGTFSFSNGMLIWPAGLVVLALRQDWKSLGIWLLFAAAAITGYLSGLPSQGNEDGVTFLFRKPYMFFLGFWGFLGGLFDLLPRHRPLTWRLPLPVLAGIILSTAAFVWLSARLIPFAQLVRKRLPAFLKQLHERLQTRPEYTDFITGLLAFSLINAIVIGLFRPRFGLDVVVVSNYKLYPALFMVAVYLAFLTVLPPSRFLRASFRTVTGIALLIWTAGCLYQLPDIIERRKYLLVNAYNQEHNGFGLGFSRNTPAAVIIDTLMKQCVSQGIYQFPEGLQELVKAAGAAAGSPAAAGITVSGSERSGGLLVVQEAIPYRFRYNDGGYAFLRSADQLYLFKLEQSPYTGINPFRQFEKNRYVEIPYHNVIPGSYDLGIVSIENGTFRSGILAEREVPAIN